jgi:hypothetical protein
MFVLLFFEIAYPSLYKDGIMRILRLVLFTKQVSLLTFQLEIRYLYLLRFLSKLKINLI